MLADVGEQELVSADKAKHERGWTMRPLEETILDTAASLTAHHLIGQ